MSLSFIKTSPVTHILFTLVFLVSGLIVNLFQITFFLILWPLNKQLFRKVNYLFSYIINAEFVFLSDWWCGVNYHYYAKKEDFKYFGKEHAILILNHKYEIDWITAWSITERFGLLGNCKAFAKDSLKYVPIIGWSWWFAEFMFLQRDLVKDKYTIENKFKEFFEYENPVALLLYAEGTRFTQEKYEASVKYARSKGLTELKQHLLPRTKGFSLGLPTFRHNLPAVYNVQLAFKGKEAPTLKSLLKGKQLDAHIYMERIPVEQIPNDQKECDKWMYEVFEKKDKLMDSFVNTGDWFKESGIERLEDSKLPLRYNAVVNMVFWSLLILVPFFYAGFKILISGNLLHIILFMIPIGFLHIILSKLVRVTEVNKASSNYGTEKSKTK